MVDALGKADSEKLRKKVQRKLEEENESIAEDSMY